MFARTLSAPAGRSFFLFGPRGTGKSTWVRSELPQALRLDLLDLGLYGELLREPHRLESMIDGVGASEIILDEVQRLPALLDEVHRLIELRGWRFAMTGSSARKLRRGGVNLLAGRARTLRMHPLTAAELGAAFDLSRAVRHGHLPTAVTESDPAGFLQSYVGTYLREEVQAEALTRNLEGFARFLGVAALSQGAPLSVAGIATDVGLSRKTVEGWFDLVIDLLLGVRIPVFTRRARRTVTAHPKFYFFDAGVYRALRPRGPLDSADEVDGPAVETLVLQELRATNDNLALGYDLFTWRTRDGREVDFVLYGERGLHAIEVKRGHRLRDGDLDGLRAFREDYPEAAPRLLYGGDRAYEVDGIRVEPLASALPRLGKILG